MSESRWIKAKAVASTAAERFPEIKGAAETWVEEWAFDTAMGGSGPPGLHLFFGEVFESPFLLPALEDPDEDPELLRRIFAFLEELASSGDADLHEVIQVGVCERIGDSRAHLERARRYMGPETLAASAKAEAELKRHREP